jgi:two-component system OmpR family response regulator
MWEIQEASRMYREHYDGPDRVDEVMSGTGGSLQLPVPRDLPLDAGGPLPHVLIVDGDAGTRSVLAGYLERHRMRVTPAADGDAMWGVVKHQLIDLLILEIDLRGVDGLSLCRMLRMGSQVPIMLTGCADDVDPITGFEFGADAYVARPYDVREVLARAKGILRRMKGVVRAPFLQGIHAYRFSGWTLDVVGRIFHGPNIERIRLSGSEHRLLATLLANPSTVLSRDVLRKVTQGRNERSTDVCVSRLRALLGDEARSPRIIKTVYGDGYTVAVAVEALKSGAG